MSVLVHIHACLIFRDTIFANQDGTSFGGGGDARHDPNVEQRPGPAEYSVKGTRYDGNR